MTTAGTHGGEGAVALAARAADDHGAGPEPGTRAAQMEATRRALLDAARALFTDQGYQATRTEEIVRTAGVTRGALYHHFADKEDLFRAVLAEVEAEVDATLQRRAEDPSLSSWALFRINSERQLSAAASNPSYRRIALVDGPAVLGANEWSERQRASTMRVESYLARAMEEGDIEAVPVETLARLLMALGSAAALTLAEAGEAGVDEGAVRRITDAMLGGLEVGSRT
jgi:AcrR family transcriptional regulator